MLVYLFCSSDEEGGLSITDESRSHPDSRRELSSVGMATKQRRQPPRRPRLLKKKETPEREGSEEGAPVEGETKEREYEDEDFGEFKKHACYINVHVHVVPATGIAIQCRNVHTVYSGTSLLRLGPHKVS